MMQEIWERLRIITRIMGDYQGRAVILAFYFTVFVPFALITRLRGDALHLRPQPPAWHPRPPVSDDLEAARRQF